jgi:hypothetical protein
MLCQCGDLLLHPAEGAARVLRNVLIRYLLARRNGHRVFTSLVFAMFDWKLPKLQKQIDDESRARLKYLKKRLDEA